MSREKYKQKSDIFNIFSIYIFINIFNITTISRVPTSIIRGPNHNCYNIHKSC